MGQSANGKQWQKLRKVTVQTGKSVGSAGFSRLCARFAAGISRWQGADIIPGLPPGDAGAS